MLAARQGMRPGRRRNAAFACGLVMAAATVLATVASSPAVGADGALQAPVAVYGYAGSGQQAGVSVDGPAGAIVDVRIATSAPDGQTCTKAMTGPGVTTLPTKQVTLDGTGHKDVIVSGAALTAGQFLYATATSGDTTTAVGPCVLLGAGPPQDVHVTGVTVSSVTVGWTPTAGASAQYARLMRRGGAVLQAEELDGAASSVTFTGLGASYTYLVSVTSVIFPGDDPPAYGSQTPQSIVPPFTSPTALARQQYHDVLGRAPTATELGDWTTDIGVNGTFAKVRVDRLIESPQWAGIQRPVIRVYRAALGRWPDAGGLAYWANRHRGGTSVRMIATVMSQSSEFRSKYGALTNREFVKRVYVNVLGRQPDRTGLDYWTRRLDVGALNRGELILQFSESDENVNHTSNDVEAINVFTALLHRVPTSAELSTWGGVAADSRTDLIVHIFGTAEYAARITA